jgi:beta-lactamase regulating signal transducer with metallopeptidase domain
MTTLIESGRRAAADLLPGMASHVWSATIFLLAILVTLFALRRRLTAGARFSLVMIGLAKFALPDAAVGAGVRALGDAFRIDARGPLAVPLQAVAGALRVDLVPAEIRLWPAIVLGVWWAVAFVLIVRLVRAHRLTVLSARTVLPARPREVAALARARRRAGAHGRIDIARSPLPGAPAVLSIRRPLIVLPIAGCDDLTDDELESLLCHECAHVARRDNLLARCASLLCALFWFHPLVWIARRILMIEREQACDEIVAGSADRGEIYLAALTKFCHAAIGPELPGISRMATTQLKERMNHVMHYADLKAQAPSPLRVTLLGVAALALFTLASGIVGSDRVLAQDKKANDPYAVRINARRTGGAIAVAGSVRENATQTVIAAPALTLDASRRGSARSSAPGGVQVAFEARPEGSDRITVEVSVEKSGEVIQKSTLLVTPSDAATADRPQEYSGDPIDLSLANANLREVLATFGQISGMQVQIDDDIQGKVSTSWHNVPWDEALDSVVRENGLTYRIEGKTLHVSRAARK